MTGNIYVTPILGVESAFVKFQTSASLSCRFPLLAFVRKRLFCASQPDEHVNRSLAKFICNICIIQEINDTILKLQGISSF